MFLIDIIQKYSVEIATYLTIVCGLIEIFGIAYKVFRYIQSNKSSDKQTAKKIVKYTRLDKIVMLDNNSSIRFIVRDNHPRKPICPDCHEKKNSREYLSYDKNYDSFEKLGGKVEEKGLTCAACNYLIKLPNGHTLETLADEAEKQSTNQNP